MSLSRRNFLKGLFSGVVLVGAGAGVGHLIRTFHKHEHYTAPGKFNVWYVHDKHWHLLSDRYEAPFEFDSKKDAEAYVIASGLKTYDSYKKHVVGYVTEGKVRVRPAPTEVHNFDMLRLDEASALVTVSDWGITDPALHDMAIKMLMAKDGGEQSLLCEIFVISSDNYFVAEAITVILESLRSLLHPI
jgi:hypothetical protein